MLRVHPLSVAVIRRTPRRLRRPVAAAIRTIDAAIADRLPGLAAEIAFWVLLSLPALVLAVIAAVSLVVGTDETGWQDQIITQVRDVASVALTPGTIDAAVDILELLFEEATPQVISFAFIAALWTASRAVKVVLETIAVVAGRADERPGWKVRLLGFGVTVVALVIGVVLAPLLIAGPGFGETLEGWLADGTGVDVRLVATIWTAAYWPVVVVVATLGLALLYQVGVPGRTRWRGSWPGAVLATSVWLLGSAGLRLYGATIADGSSAYGPLAGPIVALLWLWVTGFAVLLGAELNAQLARTWPAIRDDPDRLAAEGRAPETTAELLGEPVEPNDPVAPVEPDDESTQVIRPITDPAGPPRRRS
jgi:membrane protein